MWQAIDRQGGLGLGIAAVRSVGHRAGDFLQLGIRSIDRNIAVFGPALAVAGLTRAG
jgi:hypothetical protein